LLYCSSINLLHLVAAEQYSSSLCTLSELIHTQGTLSQHHITKIDVFIPGSARFLSMCPIETFCVVTLTSKELHSHHLRRSDIARLGYLFWLTLPFPQFCDTGFVCSLNSNSTVLVSAAAGNKSATRPPLPLPACGGEWKERGRNRWVGIRAV